MHTLPDAHHDRYDIACIGQQGRFHTERVRLQQKLAERYRTYFTSGLTREEMALVYAHSRIVFNKRIVFNEGRHSGLNMRVFEGLASRALLVTDAGANGLTELFKPGEDLITYANEDDILQKTDYYLDHEDERQEIAQHGQAKVLASHTYRHRLEWLLQHVPSQPAAPLRTASAAEWLRSTHERTPPARCPSLPSERR
jgi:glycosyltransferase involved in cell wall biosynthesis